MAEMRSLEGLLKLKGRKLLRTNSFLGFYSKMKLGRAVAFNLFLIVRYFTPDMYITESRSHLKGESYDHEKVLNSY
ncbi:MAG: hypothetical protein C5B59_20300 [Bacteroidetes bacterium]|nr:MAG: hypothetical protein C5B59_20300 [Bacteroidota bacterium]